MTPDQRKRAQMLAHCQQIHPDDGLDPNEFFRKPGRTAKRDRKTDQLCHQVAQTLSLVLAGDFDDALLLSLQVISVSPAPNASQLLMTVCSDDPAYTPDAVHARLTAVQGHLRSALAAAITRKRAPKLLFCISGSTKKNRSEVTP